MMAFGEHLNVLCHACIGGKSVADDIRALQAGMHVVSGTPGRVYDMIRRRSLNTKHIKMLVIDEADEMLGRGFKEQLYDIYRYLPPETQVCVFVVLLILVCVFMHSETRGRLFQNMSNMFFDRNACPVP